ncbi:hypothetical protein ACQP04_23470 [Pseudonocardia halophobica]|uniref:hypothetical protein n=1 Tax=Pseudonocardia halophobica TaxID=29401 RepID=UPI003D8CD411
MTATHATVATFALDLSREEENGRALRELIIPGARRHAGFESGSWLLDRDARQSIAVVTFSSREAAESFRVDVEGNEEGRSTRGIALIDIRVLEVTATAAP